MHHCILHVSAQVSNFSWVATYIHACTNETYSLYSTSTRSLANNILAKHHDAKVGIKSCRGAREYVSFVHVCMYVCSYPCSCDAHNNQTHFSPLLDRYVN